MFDYWRCVVNINTLLCNSSIKRKINFENLSIRSAVAFFDKKSGLQATIFFLFNACQQKAHVFSMMNTYPHCFKSLQFRTFIQKLTIKSILQFVDVQMNIVNFYKTFPNGRDFNVLKHCASGKLYNTKHTSHMPLER